MGTFKASLPLTATSFVNKVGNIGLSLLPIMLVERSSTIGQSSLVMLLTKGAALLATFIGGFLSDRVPAKRIILMSFALSAIGLTGMSGSKAVTTLAGCAILAQFGTSLFNSPARLLLTRLVEKRHYQEAIAWLRTANNAGQIVSYGVGAAFSSLGSGVLVLFDAATSAIAFACGSHWLPKIPVIPQCKPEAGKPQASTSVSESWTPYVLATSLVVGSDIIYEMFMTGAAAKYRLAFGPAGLKIFSTGMVINTVLCTVLAIFAAKLFKSARLALVLGLLFESTGAALALFQTQSVLVIYCGMFVLTIGEVVFASLAQVVLIHSIPQHRAPGSVYGFALSLQVTGRMVGSALAFPLVAYGAHPGLIMLALSVPFLAISLIGGKRLSVMQ